MFSIYVSGQIKVGGQDFQTFGKVCLQPITKVVETLFNVEVLPIV